MKDLVVVITNYSSILTNKDLATVYWCGDALLITPIIEGNKNYWYATGLCCEQSTTHFALSKSTFDGPDFNLKTLRMKSLNIHTNSLN